MKSEVTITGAGVGSLIAAHYLKKLGYNVTLSDADTLPYTELHVYLQGTLFGATAVTGDTTKDSHTLKGFETGVKTALPEYFTSLTSAPKRTALFKPKSASIHGHAQKHFTTAEVQKIVQFPFVLLGIDPRKTSAFPTITISANQASSQMIAIRLLLNRGYRKINMHNIILSKNWDKNIKGLFNSKTWPGDPTIYVGAIGSKELIIEVPIPKSASYSKAELDNYADWIISSASKTLHLKELEKRIANKEVIGPRLVNS